MAGARRSCGMWAVALGTVVLAGCGDSNVLQPRRAAQHAWIFQHLWDDHGDPSLVGTPSPDGNKGSVVGWRICPRGRPCQSLVSDGTPFEPGTTQAGTRFELIVDYEGRESRTLSRAWLGRLRVASAPRIDGRVSIGARLRPVPARWSGGWTERGTSDEMRIEACRKPTPSHCETLLGPSESSADDGSVLISRYYAGWWVQALDVRHAQDTVFPLIAYMDALAVPPIDRSAVDVAVSKPVRVPGGPATIPRVKLRRRAALEHGRLVIGAVTCKRCRVKVSATVGRARTQQVVEIRKTGRLRLKRSVSRRNAGISALVALDGRRLANDFIAAAR